MKYQLVLINTKNRFSKKNIKVIAAPWGRPTPPLVVTTPEGSCRRRRLHA
jgi:hypothetical protein